MLESALVFKSQFYYKAALVLSFILWYMPSFLMELEEEKNEMYIEKPSKSKKSHKDTILNY